MGYSRNANCCNAAAVSHKNGQWSEGLLLGIICSFNGFGQGFYVVFEVIKWGVFIFFYPVINFLHIALYSLG